MTKNTKTFLQMASVAVTLLLVSSCVGVKLMSKVKYDITCDKNVPINIECTTGNGSDLAATSANGKFSLEFPINAQFQAYVHASKSQTSPDKDLNITIDIYKNGKKIRSESGTNEITISEIIN